MGKRYFTTRASMNVKRGNENKEITLMRLKLMRVLPHDDNIPQHRWFHFTFPLMYLYHLQTQTQPYDLQFFLEIKILKASIFK